MKLLLILNRSVNGNGRRPSSNRRVGKGEAVSWGCEGGEHGRRPSQSGSHT